MLRASAISKTYGAEPVLTDVSFVLSGGERLGLVGPNGSGKSTLLLILAGSVSPDSGAVWVDPKDSVGYLPQYPRDEVHLSVRDALLWRAGSVGTLAQRLGELEAALGRVSGEQLQSVMQEYAQVQEDFERAGGYALEARMEEIVSGLAIDMASLDMPVAALSGGNKTKLSLAGLLLSQASILLLDEPTNYLDLQALLWLERFVTESDRSYVVVSHDRRFLDRTVSGILELEGETHGLRAWPGNYSAYAEARLRERQKRLEEYRDQQAEIRRIEEDIKRTREQARKIDSRTQTFYRNRGVTRFQLGVDRSRAGKVARKAKVREQKLADDLEERRVEKPVASWNLHLADLGRAPIEDNRNVLEIEGLTAGYGSHTVLHGLNLLVRGRDRVALLGQNGSGKTTLVRCIMGALPFEGAVRLGPSIRIGLFSQERDDLPLERTVLEMFRERTEMREDEARTYLHKFLFKGDEVKKPVRSLSYGQQAKLALALLIVSEANFLVLDEPTSHLDMPALEAMEEALAAYRGPLLLISHDRYFVERIAINRLELLEVGTLHAIERMDDLERALS